MEPISIRYTLDEIGQVVRRLWEEGKGYTVWSFSGDMGAGKTTLVSALCHYLGVQDAVSSPTYAIVNEYIARGNGTTIIYHCDWYRLKNADEAREAGMEDILYRPGTYAFIEWAEQAPELLDKPFLKISIETLNATERQMQISG